jgi:cystathionine gamma-lyase / homocysteine desulfhydrase
MDELKATTRALLTRVQIEGSLPVTTPLFQSSAFQSGSPHFYTRKSNPNSEEFENVVKTLEGTEFAVSVTTGMSAIALTLELLVPGETLVINQDIYGCSFKYFQRIAARRKLNLKILDLSKRENFSQIPTETKMVLFETPTNPFLKTISISEVSNFVKKQNPQALIVVDNTWATPLFQSPTKCGADISLHSATKYFSGHSDVMGGVILTDRADLYEEIRQERFFVGCILAPHSAWLLCRSLQTLPLRMREHERVTKEMVSYLRDLPEIKKIYYPEVDGKQMSGYGGIIFFQFIEELHGAYSSFIKNLKLFKTGTGMAAVTSMVAQPFTGSHASMSSDEKYAMNLDEGLVRLCFGLEDPEDLKTDLRQAFKALNLRQTAIQNHL